MAVVVVAGGGDDRDVQRVELGDEVADPPDVRAPGQVRRAVVAAVGDGEVDDADVPLGVVVDHPLERVADVVEAAAAVVAEDAEGDHVGAGGDARVRRVVAGGDPGDGRAVHVVVRARVAVVHREVVAGDRVGARDGEGRAARVDAGVDDGDRQAGAVDAVPVAGGGGADQGVGRGRHGRRRDGRLGRQRGDGDGRRLGGAEHQAGLEGFEPGSAALGPAGSVSRHGKGALGRPREARSAARGAGHDGGGRPAGGAGRSAGAGPPGGRRPFGIRDATPPGRGGRFDGLATRSHPAARPGRGPGRCFRRRPVLGPPGDPGPTAPGVATGRVDRPFISRSTDSVPRCSVESAGRAPGLHARTPGFSAGPPPDRSRRHSRHGPHAAGVPRRHRTAPTGPRRARRPRRRPGVDLTPMVSIRGPLKDCLVSV